MVEIKISLGRDDLGVKLATNSLNAIGGACVWCFVDFCFLRCSCRARGPRRTTEGPQVLSILHEHANQELEEIPLDSPKVLHKVEKQVFGSHRCGCGVQIMFWSFNHGCVNGVRDGNCSV